MNNKIIATKRTSAIFLAIVLVTGTIAAISPSSFIIGEAQAAPYYGMDNNYEKSYGKDNRDKSKDSKSVSINKLKCINTNLNINGNNAGNVSIGNKGSTGGYLGAYSSDGSGSGYGVGGYDGFKKDKDFTCIINNNNTNVNTVGGNVTDDDERDPCVECFRQVLNANAFTDLEEILEEEGITIFIPSGSITTQVEINSLLELCRILENLSGRALLLVIEDFLEAADITLTPPEELELVDCIATALGIPLPTPE